MEFRDFFAGENDNDRRLDRVARFFLTNAPLSEIYKMIRKGLIKVNGKKTKPNCMVKKGDKISVAEFLTVDGKVSKNSESCAKKIDIKEITVFQNEHILILEKPYNIKVHGDENSLDAAVKKYYGETFESSSLSFAPGPLHRLDRKTTGLIAFSLSLKGAKWFSENIHSHKIKKIYIGIVQGKMTETERWEDFISKNGDTPQKVCFKKSNGTHKKINPAKGNVPLQADFESFKTVAISQSPSGAFVKKAVTTAKPMQCRTFSGMETTLVEFDIETGRTHQIRSQCAAHGFPLFGDTAYGGKKIIPNGKNEKFQKRARDFYLHAAKLVLPKNDLNLPREIISEPKDFPAIFFQG